MIRLGGPLELVDLRPFYLLSTAAFFSLFVLRSHRLYRLGLGLLEPVDRWLLDRIPALARLAWRAAALYRKPSHGA
jgi:hypothetical protein